MEKHALKNVSDCWNKNISFYIEISGVQSYKLMLFIFSTPVLIRQLWQFKTVVYLHRPLICIVLLLQNNQPDTNALAYCTDDSDEVLEYRPPQTCCFNFETEFHFMTVFFTFYESGMGRQVWSHVNTFPKISAYN